MAVAGDMESMPIYKDTVGRHTLLEKGTFAQLHRNEIIETRPHILHFGGFQIHKEHTHILRILNISPSSLRVSIIGPTTAYFRISYDKKGLLAPGMSEEITVTFTPHEWRYYYDTVKIFCGELHENLIVPIHAYPSANDIVLPRIVDFGGVAIGTSRTKVIPLSCKIPIQFEFEITILESHPDFQVAPLSGVIPPDGVTNIVITFLPTKHRTARTELQFNIAQFDFDPITVTVVGSCLPDVSRNDILDTVKSERAATATHQKQEQTADKIRTLQEKKHRKQIDVKPPSFTFEMPERHVEGVKIPTSNLGPQATNFVLNQTAGKLPLKDLASFIRDQREAAESRRRRAESNKETGRHLGGTGSDDGSDVEDDDRQALELRFEMKYREVNKYDKEKELKSMAAIGEDQLSEVDIQRASDYRTRRHAHLLESRMQTDVARITSVLSTAHVAVPDSYKPALSPQWDENANDTFSVRLQVIDRFVRVGSKCLMQRVRAQKRVECLRTAMRAANVVDRASCKAWVEAENKAAAAGTNGASPSTAGVDDDDAEKLDIVRIPADFVLPLQTPTSRSAMNVEERQPVDVYPLDNFEVFMPMPINVRLDYKVLQYERHKVPPPAAYMRPHNDRGRLHAALEESLVRGPRGDALDGAEVPIAMPESCLLPPEHNALSLLVPSTECRTYVGLPESTECDTDYRLAQLAPALKPLNSEQLLPPHIMCLDEPWLASWRRTRQIADPFQHFDSFPSSFAEAGGQLGPRLGCDAGGEPLSFLPVGGYQRDLPSDTDSDERDDFHLPAPDDEAYQTATSSMECPLTSDLWQKEMAVEGQLRASRVSSSEAVRKRLCELNENLEPRNKLYLG